MGLVLRGLRRHRLIVECSALSEHEVFSQVDMWIAGDFDFEEDCTTSNELAH